MKWPNWHGKTCVIMASGPGLSDDQVDCVRRNTQRGNPEDRTKVIAINSTFKIAPWVDVVFAGDLQFWRVYIKEIRKTCPAAQLWTGDHQAQAHYQVNRIKCVNRPGLGHQYMHMGGNSGYQAINLAYLFGCRHILLLGFTMREIDGRKHWHEDHPKPLTQKILPDEWRHKFTALARDLETAQCEVVNCDPLSALTCFKMSDITQELLK